MLQELNEELAGAVLRRLAAADVRRARLACRALDAASRSHLDAATCIKLTGDNVKKVRPAALESQLLPVLVGMQQCVSAHSAAAIAAAVWKWLPPPQ